MGNAKKKYKTFGENRSLRLKSFDYSQPYRAYFLTLCTKDKKTYFSNDRICARILSSLKAACGQGGYRLLAYCLMPDHLHILIHGEEKPKDLRTWVRDFKKYTTSTCEDSLTNDKLWQRSYYEHIIRKDEDILKKAEYIVNNPLRKGLVHRRKDYKWQDIFA
ncbi:MAG: REP-associated tyrosine transposase [Planctomycetota bacterium]|jgi:putative transposase